MNFYLQDLERPRVGRVEQRLDLRVHGLVGVGAEVARASGRAEEALLFADNAQPQLLRHSELLHHRFCDGSPGLQVCTGTP